MLVNVCLILTIISPSLGYREHEYTPNVGTVLFTVSDNEKSQWTKAEISLLRARRYFQTIIPPLDIINSFNEDYVNILLEYFRDTYSNIKREAADLETDSIMTAALSDVVGGYLKVWVLPVAKLDFYGGTISQENIVKLFLFYDEIKNYLGTDGEGWHCPDEDILNTLTINIAPPKQVSSTRSIKDPCEQLAYFEKTPNGLDIPLPQIHWNSKSSTLFLPLKNISLIPMNDPGTASALVKYYDTAKSCIETTNPSQLEIFETRFQNWLSDNVIPHLNDDDVYLALGSVLALVNRTNAIAKSLKCTTTEKTHAAKFKIYPIRLPFEITSKKMMIIFIILLLEVAWCIPAMIYIICSKRKRDCSSNVYLFIDQGKSDKRDKCFGRRPKTTRNVCLGPRPASCKTLQDIETQNPSTAFCPCDTETSAARMFYTREQVVTNVPTQCPSAKITLAMGTGSRAYFSSKNQCCEATEIEYFNAPKKSSLKKSKDVQVQPNYTVQMTSISKEGGLGIAPESAPIEEAKKSPAKKSNRIKDTYPISPSKRQEHSKEPKNVSPTKRSDQNRDAKPATLKPTESKSASLKQNHPNQHSKASLRNYPIQDSKYHAGDEPKKQSSEDSKSASLKQNHSNRSFKSASPSKRSHQSKDLISGSYSFTKMSSRGDNDRICELVEVQSLKEMPSKQSASDSTKLADSKMFDIEEELFINTSPDKEPACPCTDCLRDKENIEHEIRVENFDKIITQTLGKTEEVVVADPCFVEGNTNANQQLSQEQRLAKAKKASFKVTDDGKPFFEITIDRPATEICVDVRGMPQPQMYSAPLKRSRIPKPNVNLQQALISRLSESEHSSQPSQSTKHTSSRKAKSLIPQLKRKTVDDIALEHGCACAPRDKLNDTF